jgi:hypothetical protein
MKARTVWLLWLPLLLLSETFGHALVARMVEPGNTRHRLVLRAAVDYREFAHVALGAVVVLTGAALARRALASFRRAEPQPLPGWRLAAIPALILLVEEHVERLAQDGEIGWLTAVEPAVLAGVALQIPVGLVAVWLARVLLRAADQIGWALARRSSSAARRIGASRPLFICTSSLRLRVLASRHAGRAPPAFV